MRPSQCIVFIVLVLIVHEGSAEQAADAIQELGGLTDHLEHTLDKPGPLDAQLKAVEVRIAALKKAQATLKARNAGLSEKAKASMHILAKHAKVNSAKTGKLYGVGEDAEKCAGGISQWADVLSTCTNAISRLSGHVPSRKTKKKLKKAAARKTTKKKCPGGIGKSVTCQLTVDNYLIAVSYNGKPLKWSGNARAWNHNKIIHFKTVDCGVLEVKGHDAEGGNKGHCKTAGFAIQCRSKDKFWGKFNSGSRNIQAAGGKDVNGRSWSGWAAPCTTRSGFYLPANRGLKKLWAPKGQRWGKFRMGPKVRL